MTYVNSYGYTVQEPTHNAYADTAASAGNLHGCAPAVARGTACSGTPRVVVLLGRTLTAALNVEPQLVVWIGIAWIGAPRVVVLLG